MAGKNPFGAPVADEDEEFSVDCTEVAEGYRIEAGGYPAKLLSVSKEKSKSSGNDMFVWQFAIVGDKYGGKEFRVYTSLAPAALFKLAETVKAFGLPGAGSVVKFKKTDVEGKRVMLMIVDDTYNDEPSSSVKKVFAHPDGPDMPKGSVAAGLPGKKKK